MKVILRNPHASDGRDFRHSLTVGGEYEAVVKVVDNVFDPASRTFGVRLNLDNSDYSLPAGLRCQLKFVEEETQQSSS